MKIFLVCNSLGGGGAERVGVNLANGFVGEGHTVYFFTDLFQKVTYSIDERVHIVGFNDRKEGKIKKWYHAILNIRKISKEQKPDAVIGIMHLCSIIAKIATMGLGTPVVLTIHHALERIKTLKTSHLNLFCDRELSKIYSHVTVLTEADAKVLKNRNNVSIMPNPLSFSPIIIDKNGNFISKKGEIINKEKIVFAAGRLYDWQFKGWDILIKAAAAIKTLLAEKGWKIQIAGDGSPSVVKHLTDMCCEYGVSDVIEFLGYRTDVKDLMQRASIFCLSSRSEGLPMVLIEAMSQGCAPVACENLGRTKEIITNESEGLLFQTADAEDLADKLSKMIVDNDYRQSVQRNAIERSKYYSLDHIIGMWEEMLKKLFSV